MTYKQFSRNINRQWRKHERSKKRYAVFLAVMIAGVLVTGVSAGWFFSDYPMVFDMKSGSSPSMEVSAVTCNGINHTVTQCDYDDISRTFTIGYTEIFPDTMIMVSFNAFNPAGNGVLHISLDKGALPLWVLRVDEFECADADLAEDTNTTCMFQAWVNPEEMQPDMTLEALNFKYHLERLP